MYLQCDDVEIHYDVVGSGPDIVLLHPFPSSRQFWKPIISRFDSDYRLILPDLRGLGKSASGDRTITMERHAKDLLHLCDELKIGRATFVGCSIGGYILFEAWRRFRERFNSLVLCDTKPEADDDTARTNRLQSAEDVLLRGPELFISNALPKLIGESTQRNRPDIFAAARATTASSTAKGIALVQRGMAEREDSTRTLAQIDVPTMVIVGEEDISTPPVLAGGMASKIRNSEFHMIRSAGHYSPFEQPDEFSRLLRPFLDTYSRH